MSEQFLGSTEVDQPKGIEVVKQGIQRLKFNQQLKKSESGQVTRLDYLHDLIFVRLTFFFLDKICEITRVFFPNVAF